MRKLTRQAKWKTYNRGFYAVIIVFLLGVMIAGASIYYEASTPMVFGLFLAILGLGAMGGLIGK